MNKILVIDDNKAVLNFLNLFLLQTEKFEVKTLQDSTKAFDILKKEDFDILILDMDMPEVTGLDILKYIHNERLKIITVVLTGVEDIDLAISAMKLGTFDYLLKPIDEEKILDILDKAADNIRIEQNFDAQQPEISRESLKHKECFSNIITQDEQMLKIFHLLEKYAMTDNSVLIWGESGTGKEFIARAIHDISERKKNKFVAVNAGVFANDLFASEFFGHEKGAFTGAVSQKKGLIEEADGGTLFLDEIGEL
ncbi:MAG: sigma 54-interacting transcriptional regulator, partial [Bacteroidota bacterium]